jgi:hypothetical protein
MNIDNDPSNVYYDLTYNNYQSLTEEPKQLTFNETRNSPLIQNPNNYNLSIIRFQLDTISLPSYIASIQPNQSNINLMIHGVNLSYWNGTTETTISITYLIWKPVHREVSLPPAPSSNSNGFQSDSAYYYGYSFLHVCEIINTAFTTALTALKTAIGGGGGAISTATAPFIYFDHDNKKFHLVGDSAFYNSNAGTHIRIYFNRPLYGLFSSFGAYRNSINNPNQNIYQIRLTGEKGTNLVQNTNWGSGITFIDYPQEYPTLSNFNPVSSLVFTTSQLPIVPNSISAPLIFNNNQLVSDANQNSLTNQIITDMANNDDFSYKPNLLYNPSAEYRRISMTSNRPIYNIDIQVFWRDKKGILHPFVVWSGGSASIKILFEKKKGLLSA